MPEQRGAEWRTALRALGSPVAAFCLVLLVLNDHLLKQAWPGWVTGKLSDVVGLVVAPLLLGVVLAALGVRRWRAWSVGLVVTGFVVTKTSAAGAAAASVGWSLTGVPHPHQGRSHRPPRPPRRPRGGLAVAAGS